MEVLVSADESTSSPLSQEKYQVIAVVVAYPKPQFDGAVTKPQNTATPKTNLLKPTSDVSQNTTYIKGVLHRDSPNMANQSTAKA